MTTATPHRHDFPPGWQRAEAIMDTWYYTTRPQASAWRYCPACGLTLLGPNEAPMPEPRCSGCERRCDACPCACYTARETRLR